MIFLKNRSVYCLVIFPSEKHILDVVPDRRQISKFLLLAWISVMGGEGADTETTRHSWSAELIKAAAAAAVRTCRSHPSLGVMLPGEKPFGKAQIFPIISLWKGRGWAELCSWEGWFGWAGLSAQLRLRCLC